MRGLFSIVRRTDARCGGG
ncbi:hypothetical protein YPPY61_1911, partial [Yersinia pestis PY-61]